MSVPQKFRSALNGFNREDVVSYLEYLNTKHTGQVNQLTSEAEFLRDKLEHATFADRDLLIRERDDLRAQVRQLRARNEELEQELEAARTAPAVPVAPAVPDRVPAANEELEIYRRAERTERMARERADLICRQASGVLNEASVRVNDMAQQVVPIADQLLQQVAQLQTAVAASKQSLQDAVVILGTLRSDNI